MPTESDINSGIDSRWCTKSNKPHRGMELISCFGGGGEIRTHERLATLPVFKTGAFNRSATPPKVKLYGVSLPRRLVIPAFYWPEQVT
jgi:hypothetical protein